MELDFNLRHAMSVLLKGLRMVDRALWRSEARRVVPWSETLHEPYTVYNARWRNNALHTML